MHHEAQQQQTLGLSQQQALLQQQMAMTQTSQQEQTLSLTQQQALLQQQHLALQQMQQQMQEQMQRNYEQIQIQREQTRSSQSIQGGTGTGNVMIDHSSAVMRTNTPMSQSPPGQVMEVSTHYSEAPDSCFRSIVARVSLVFIDRVSRVVV